MSILHIVLSFLIILILLAILRNCIYNCGFNGIGYFILIAIVEIIITPVFAYFIQIFFNFYNYLITGNRFGDGIDNLIMYYPTTVLLITGLIISFLVLWLSLNKDEF